MSSSVDAYCDPLVTRLQYQRKHGCSHPESTSSMLCWMYEASNTNVTVQCAPVTFEGITRNFFSNIPSFGTMTRLVVCLEDSNLSKMSLSNSLEGIFVVHEIYHFIIGVMLLKAHTNRSRERIW